MNLNNVEIFNCEALESIQGLGDKCLVRIPNDVRDRCCDGVRVVAMDAVGCETRFVTDAPFIDVRLSCDQPEYSPKGELRVYKGDFLYQTIEVEPGKVNTIRLEHPEAYRVATRESINGGVFSSDVWRLVFNRGRSAIILDIDTHGHEMRPPKAEEKPKLTGLAYGSSITNSNLDGYPHFAAKKLKVQIQNKGMSGACQLEKEIVDYMVDKCEWDFATCELGVNVREIFSPEKFEQRASYLIERFAATGKPVLIIGLFPNYRSEDKIIEADINTENEVAYNSILARLVEQKGAANLHFVEGSEILDDFTGLSADLLHPCAYGHAIMGANLAEKLKKIIY